MHKRLVILLILINCITIFSQQSPIYSQYILNEFLINPSVAGIDGMTTVNLSARKQWLGLKYTPETYSACISSRILKSPLSLSKGKFKKASAGKVGLGASFISDRNGAISRTSAQFAYAYHIFVQNSQLSFGMKLYGTQVRIDDRLIDLRGPDSPEIENLLGKSTFVPDAGGGINLSSQKSNIGLSVSNLFQSFIKIGDIELQSNEMQHLRQYNLHGFYRLPLANNQWVFEPSAIIRGNERLQMSADLTGRFIYNREYWAGLSVRTSGDFILLLGLKIQKIYIGYSLDYGINQLSYSSYGSHELILALKLGDSARRYRWLERY